MNTTVRIVDHLQLDPTTTNMEESIIDTSQFFIQKPSVTDDKPSSVTVNNDTNPVSTCLMINSAQAISVALTGISSLSTGEEMEDDTTNEITRLPSMPSCEISTTNDETGIESEIDTESVLRMMDVVVSYKCRCCPFTCNDTNAFMDHYTRIHSKYNKNSTAITMHSQPALPLVQDEIKDDQDPTNNNHIYNPSNCSGEDVSSEATLKNNGTDVCTDKQVTEVEVFVCGMCIQSFHSIEQCKEHIKEVHVDKSNDKPDDTPKNNAEKTSRQKCRTKEQIKSSIVENVPREKRTNKLPSKLKDYQIAKDKRKIGLQQQGRKFKCPHDGCMYRFCTKGTLRYHIMCHCNNQKVREFKCAECGDSFKKWSICATHLWKFHTIDVDLLTCPECRTYKTVSFVQLETHQRIHNVERNYECSTCGKKFKQIQQLRNHQVIHLDTKPKWYTSKVCKHCEQTFANTKCLKRHIVAVHSKLRPYVCNICGHTSAMKNMLTLHQRQHTGDKPYACKECDYKTGDHNSLRRHTMRHSGIKPYKCTICDYATIQSISLKNHVRKNHPELANSMSCNLCSYRTIDPKNLTKHLNNHKKGLIEAADDRDDFSNKDTITKLIYGCLSEFSQDSFPSKDPPSITIQIPDKIPNSTNYYLTIGHSDGEADDLEDTPDTGGITIPAPPETGGITTPAPDTAVPEHILPKV